MKHIKFRIPTSISDIKQLIREKQDKRYNHNKQVVRNMYKDILSAVKQQNPKFKETKEIKDCLIRGLKAIE